MVKITVSMKDPDALYDAIEEQIDEDIKGLGLDEDEAESVREVRHEKYAEVASQWFQYGEYLTVEFDTETKKIRVLDAE